MCLACNPHYTNEKLDLEEQYETCKVNAETKTNISTSSCRLFLSGFKDNDKNIYMVVLFLYGILYGSYTEKNRVIILSLLASISPINKSL